MLYYKAGSEPVEIPFSDVDLSGTAWTNLANNPTGRASCGWIAAPEKPSNLAGDKIISWTGTAWKVSNKPADQVATEFEAAQAKKIQDLGNIRWMMQQTVMFNGMLLPADDVTLGRCIAADAYAAHTEMDLDAPRNWTFGEGIWTTLTTRMIIQYGVAIGTHMQACFDYQKQISEQIMAAKDLKALAAIDITANWPQ